MKRICAKDVLDAPADTLVPAVTTHLDALFDRAVTHTTGRTKGASDEPVAKDRKDPLLEMERRLFPYAPDKWSDEARAEVGMPPPTPEARRIADRAHALHVIGMQDREIERLDEEDQRLKLAAEKTAQTEDRIPPAQGGVSGDGGNPRPFVRARQL